MCTRVLWDSGEGMLVGRNMDWREDLGTNLWAMPRGEQRGDHGGDTNPLIWRAEYASVIAGVFDKAATDGINEAGLGAHLLWLAESDFGDRDIALPGIPVSMWTQFFLDRFATVAEAVEHVRRHPFQVRPQGGPSGTTATVHLAIDDAGGDSAIFEYLDGRLDVHHGDHYDVMTNSPPFSAQLEHLKQYEGFGGQLPLPGTTEAADRFVRAAYYTDRLPKVDNPQRGYAALLSVMRNAAQPFGTPDPSRPNISMTIWRTLADLSKRVYAFESAFSPDIVWVHMDRLDPTTTQRLELVGHDLNGDVTNRFQPSRFAFKAA
ncbi:linear amide C-N hydrolase [Phytomonospora endophytica]|uniref:Choloylglycine hydrolase n=1 Tax=Phytomonospora endophytica TaxID=714109 RepID=A0A841FY72_9ACTN|nr:linear amide C-N hydrolase [Phytomonospora endophytica]MBB6038668.1 choloylglycine hydrolase [Phytomonospora endophytica]GIG69187.1 choloylglycine hydrolase [Phytomonospora endophytica]